jgi:hypothetical protein
MHTKLTEFYEKLRRAACKVPGKEFEVTGLENLRTAKMQSVATGRIEETIQQLVERPDVQRVEAHFMNLIPETEHTLVLRAYGPNGEKVKAILREITIFHETEEAELAGFTDVEDKRLPLKFYHPVESLPLTGYEDIDARAKKD